MPEARHSPSGRHPRLKTSVLTLPINRGVRQTQVRFCVIWEKKVWD